MNPLATGLAFTGLYQVHGCIVARKSEEVIDCKVFKKHCQNCSHWSGFNIAYACKLNTVLYSELVNSLG